MSTSSDRETAANGKMVLIAAMGASGSGKTTFINLVSGSSLRVGTGLESCTSEVQMSTPFEMEGRWVTLIDTPGFDDTTKSDTDVLKMITAFLATAYEHGKVLSGVIYFHRISDVRMGGVSRRNFTMFNKLCGDDIMKNVVILTNMWGEVTREVGEARESQLASQEMFFKPAIANKAKLLRHENTLESGQNILRKIIGNDPLPLRIQRELIDQGLDISQTEAAETLDRELKEKFEKHQEDMRALQDELQEAIMEKDEESKTMLEEEKQKLQDEMARMQVDAQKLGADYKAEKARLERLLGEATADASTRNTVRVPAEAARQNPTGMHSDTARPINTRVSSDAARHNFARLPDNAASRSTIRTPANVTRQGIARAPVDIPRQNLAEPPVDMARRNNSRLLADGRQHGLTGIPAEGRGQSTVGLYDAARWNAQWSPAGYQGQGSAGTLGDATRQNSTVVPYGSARQSSTRAPAEYSGQDQVANARYGPRRPRSFTIEICSVQ